jgi:hypothetical protein
MIHDVIVDQSEVVHDLDRGSSVDRVAGASADCLAREENEDGAETLPATRKNIGAGFCQVFRSSGANDA